MLKREQIQAVDHIRLRGLIIRSKGISRNKVRGSRAVSVIGIVRVGVQRLCGRVGYRAVSVYAAHYRAGEQIDIQNSERYKDFK